MSPRRVRAFVSTSAPKNVAWANLNADIGPACDNGSTPAGAGNTARGLTRSSGTSREGLAMKATRKTCRKCGQSEPEAKFDATRRTCRTCRYSGPRRERALQWAREFRAENPDVIQQRNRAYYEANADQIKANYRDNPHLRWSAEYRRRMSRLGLPADVVEEFTKADVVGRYGPDCFYCGGPFEELDHYVPLARNGPHSLVNVRPSCLACNRAKGAR